MTANLSIDKGVGTADSSAGEHLPGANLAHKDSASNQVNQAGLNPANKNQASLPQPILHQHGLHQHGLHHHSQNHILAALPAADLAILSPHLQLVNLPVGTMLYEPGQESRYAYFPTSCLISLQHMLESGRTAETASVGNDGLVGVALFMGGNSTPSSAVVQISGYAYQLEGNVLKQEFKRLIPLQQLLLRYTQVLLTQISLTAVCNRHHSLQQQLCRWLLLTLDRLNTNEITMTQELVAGMLGVRREGITEAAGHLQREGLITYRRGHITVINRKGIETHVCECYGVLKKELLRLLPEAI